MDGIRFRDVLDAVPCGVKVASNGGKIKINPDDDYVLKEGKQEGSYYTWGLPSFEENETCEGAKEGKIEKKKMERRSRVINTTCIPG